MPTQAISPSEELRITPTPCYKKPSSYIKITLVVIAVLLSAAAIFVYLQGIGTLSSILLGSGSLVTFISFVLFHFLHRRRVNRQATPSSKSSGSQETRKNTPIKKASIYAKRAKNLSPLHLAAESGDKKSCETLLAKGAKIDAMSEGFDCTKYPIDLAIQHDHLAVVELLFEKLPENSDMNWHMRILKHAVVFQAGKVFKAFLKKPGITKVQLDSLLCTIAEGCSVKCKFGKKGAKDDLPVMLDFIKELKIKGARNTQALKNLRSEKAHEKDPAILRRYRRVEAILL